MEEKIISDNSKNDGLNWLVVNNNNLIFNKELANLAVSHNKSIQKSILIKLNPTVTAKKLIDIKNSRNFCNLNQ